MECLEKSQVKRLLLLDLAVDPSRTRFPGSWLFGNIHIHKLPRERKSPASLNKSAAKRSSGCDPLSIVHTEVSHCAVIQAYFVPKKTFQRILVVGCLLAFVRNGFMCNLATIEKSWESI